MVGREVIDTRVVWQFGDDGSASSCQTLCLFVVHGRPAATLIVDETSNVALFPESHLYLCGCVRTWYNAYPLR